MQYVGLDVHKSFTTMGPFDPATGELADLGNVPTRHRELSEALERIGGAKTVVLEAGRSDPHAKILALIAPARHRTRRLYKLLRRVPTQPEELVA